MDFALNEEQEMLQKSARTFLSRQYSDKLFKQLAQDEKGCPPELWRQIAEMGWTALGIPEQYGGIGSFLDITLVLQEMGRAGFISPFFSSSVVGASVILDAGSSDQKNRYLPPLAEGKSIVTVALNDSIGQPQPIPVKAFKTAAGYTISGKKVLVPDVCVADYLVCAVHLDESSGLQPGLGLFMVDSRTNGITRTFTESISGDKYGEVVLDQVKVPVSNLLCDPHQSEACLEKVFEKAAVGLCAQMLGGMERALEMSVSYAKERIAFGHPIGAYQSIQHRCANMLMDVESSKYVTYQAAWYLSEGLPAAREVAIAKAWVSQACIRVMTSAQQIHGAIAFTDDFILHRFTRKAWANGLTYGDADFHLENLLKLSSR